MAAAPPTSSPPSSSPPTSRGGTPRIVGRYALFGEIARGGMATVHFGRLLGEVGFSRTVAIKRLHPHYATDEEFVTMFLDEARLAGRIQHPNVVSTIDVVATDGELMLVMEYVQGESLSKLLATLRAQGQRAPLRIIGGVIGGVLAGLHAAHEAKNERGEPLGIVHRDMSPQNVLVGADGVVRVFDFGVAKAAGRAQDTRAGLFKGKLAYAAPEQLAGKDVDRRVDVFAASVVLWEMLTGRRMYKFDNELQLYGMVREGRVEPPSKYVQDLPAGLEELVMKGLTADPRQRFVSARQMAIALESVLPSASAREMSEWVEAIVPDQLKKRARVVEEIETSSPTLSQVRSLAALAAPSTGSMPPVAPPVEEPRRRRAVWVLSGLLVLMSAITGASLALHRTTGPQLVEEPQVGAAAPKPTQQAAATAQPTASVTEIVPVVADAPKKNDKPFETKPEAKAPVWIKGPVVAPVAKPVESAKAPVDSAAPKPSAAPTLEVSAKPEAPAANCSPPFTIDSEGIRHPKPECL